MAGRKKKGEPTLVVDNGAQAPAPIGHNGGAPVDSKTFFEHVRNIESAERRKDKAVQELRQARKEAKGAGLELAEFDAIRKLQKYSEPELAQKFNTLATYAKFMGTPVYGQMTLFEPQESEIDEAAAYSRGTVSGKRGEPVDRNPWPIETALGTAWGNGHKDGNMELASSFKPLADAAPPPG